MIEFDLDLKSLSDKEIKEIGEAVVHELVVVFKNQKLTPEDEVNFCKVIGECQTVLDPTKDREGQRTEHIAVNQHILRVTGKKNDKGEPGLFGHTSALDWHANQASSKNRSPLIWLYGVEGTAGSVTSWIDCKRAYEELPQDLKEEISDIEITLGYKKGGYSNSEFFVEHHNEDTPFKLVHTNDAGHTGLYFPFLQIFGFKDRSEEYFNTTMQRLRDHVLQPHFRYDHHWLDGDVVISEQWLSIHKRWDFDNMEDRVLHRIAFDYNNLRL